ncbi:amino acid adenylation domain-containing protein, partial [Dendronalium sp. ChiSLP03b]|uniref:amino acid adenylation domain-containing protein n=1 Tax=Dendronalium sp. ChiSLP03b TaxID=3075381 RepID=UPI00391DDE5E
MMIANHTRDTLTTEELFFQKIYWLNQLSGELPETNIITDYVRPATDSANNKSIAFQLSKDLSFAIAQLTNNSNLSIYLVLLSALSILMQKYTGNNDIILGSPIYKLEDSDRNLNTIIPLRINLEEKLTFKDFLLRVKETTIDAYSHQNYLVDELVQILNLPDKQNRCPFCDVVILLENIHQQKNLADVSNDLTFSFKVSDHLILGTIDYNESVFREDVIKYIIKYYINILESVTSNCQIQIADIPLLKAEDKQQLLEFNNKVKQYPIDLTIDRLFEQQVEQTPLRIAVDYENTQLTYQQLNEKANQLARLLQKLGLNKDEIVGIYKERDINFLIGILAIQKAGGAYVPIDSQYPPDRVKYMVSNSEVKIILTDTSCLDSLSHFIESCSYLKSLICLETPLENKEFSEIIDIKIYNQSDFNHLAKENLEGSHVGTDIAYMLYTSGSTGLPKGAIVRHDGAINHIYAQFDELELTKDFRFLQSAPSSTDISVWQFLAPLLIGGQTVIVDTESGFVPDKLFKVLQEKRITVVELVPAVFGGLLDYISQLPADQRLLPDLKWMMVVGEPVSVKRVNQWLSLYPAIKVADAYGPTEAADDITQFIIEKPLIENQRTVPIGKPLANLNLYILDREMQLVPIGFPGEICVSGIGVGEGYWKNEEKTKLSFVPNPFPDSRKKLPESNKDLIYKTGDLGRWLPDGNIEFLGRIDNQVKIRGFRVELEEIEALLRQHPAVRETIVIVREETGDKRLVAYVVTQPDQYLQEDLVSELRNLLKQRLPQHMIPSAFVLLESFPLAPSGKVDRRALPAPDLTQLQSEGDFIAPSTPVEEMLAGIWAEVLGIEKIGIHDNFFELGGHSLLATRVISKLRQVFQIELPLRSLFENPTVGQLAQEIERAIKVGNGLEMPPITRISREEDLLPSFAQQRLWFLAQLEPDNPIYNIPGVVKLQGNLNITALEQSLNEILRRHEALRSNFKISQGRLVVAIAPPTPQQLSILDMSELTFAEQEAKVRQLTQTEAKTPFNFETDSLVRLKLLRLNQQEHVMLLTSNYIASDAWSAAILVHELSTLYNAFCQGQPSPLAQLPIQYPDFAAWQQQWMAGEVLESQLAYWQKQLAGAPTVLDLPTDHPRPAVQTFRGATYKFEISPELSLALKTLSQQEGCTLFMTVLAAFKTLLYRYSGSEDIIVGSPIANRNRAELEGLIGPFLNTLVLRTKLGGDFTFQELLSQVRETSLGAYAHQDLPFEQLVEVLQPERSLSHTPLFQVMFVLQNAPKSDLELIGLTSTLIDQSFGTAKFDLIFSVLETAEGLSATFEYSTDLFETDTISRMAGHLQTLLEAIVANPEQELRQLPLLTPAEQQQLLEWNDTQVEYSQIQIIHQLFEAQVERTPDAIAAVFEERQLTYRELNARANQLAHYLQTLGVKPEVLVGICVERSLEMAVGILGILKAGAAYVPLDPQLPQERLSFMLNDSQVKVLLTQQHLVTKLTEHQTVVVCLDSDWQVISQSTEENLCSDVQPSNLAYVIYTSGSTGKPKGVAMNQLPLCNLIMWQLENMKVASGAKTLQFAPVSFDVSFQEMFSTWCSGGTLYFITEELRRDPKALLDFLNQKAIERLFLPFVALQQLAEVAGDCKLIPSTLREIITAGEQLQITPTIANLFSNLTDCTLHNHYGPSESHVITAFTLTGSVNTWPALPPIGQPINNTQIYILDSHLRQVPVGVPGELHIGGISLARGYLNRPELTQEKFIPFGRSREQGAGSRGKTEDQSSNSERLYKTGDLARYLPNGEIEYIGRIDYQVKVRGFRIELGEIEAVINQHPQVRECVVVVREDEPGSKYLTAYAVLHPEQQLTITELRHFLESKLPNYMVPTAFMMLESLPLTPNGKVNRRALPTPDLEQLVSRNSFVAPSTPIEEMLAGIWAEVLNITKVGIHDNFFELGGHSLLATRVTSKLRQVFKVELPVRQLFESPTIADLAKDIERVTKAGLELNAPPITCVARSEELLLSFAQQRLWFLAQLEPGNPFYNIPGAIRLQGQLNQQALHDSLNEILRRHEVLRTTFKTIAGQPIQVISSVTMSFPVIDLSQLTGEQQEAKVKQLVQTEAQQPFNLETDLMIRAKLLRLDQHEHVLLLTFHHIASDGWSIGVFVSELSALYSALCNGQPAPLPELPIQYADFAAWQRKWLATQVLNSQFAYWQKQLAGAPAVLELPTDHPRPAVQTFRGGNYSFQISPQLTTALQ